MPCMRFRHFRRNEILQSVRSDMQRRCPWCGAPDQSVMSPCTACGRMPEETIPSTGKLETHRSTAPCLDDVSLIRRFLTPRLAENLAARGRIEGSAGR